MAINSISSMALAEALAAEDLLPPETRDVEIIGYFDDVMLLRYTVNIRGEDLQKIARAFAQMALATKP